MLRKIIPVLLFFLPVLALAGTQCAVTATVDNSTGNVVIDANVQPYDTTLGRDYTAISGHIYNGPNVMYIDQSQDTTNDTLNMISPSTPFPNGTYQAYIQATACGEPGDFCNDCEPSNPTFVDFTVNKPGGNSPVAINVTNETPSVDSTWTGSGDNGYSFQGSSPSGNYSDTQPAIDGTTYIISPQAIDCYDYSVSSDDESATGSSGYTSTSSEKGFPGDTINFNITYTKNNSCPPSPPPATGWIRCNGSDNSCTIAYNTSANISWHADNADVSPNCSVSSSGQTLWTQDTNDTQSTGNLTANKVYTLDCFGSGGNYENSVTVVVNQPPAPTGDIQCNSQESSCTVNYGQSATLSWSSSNATSCSVSPGGWSGLSNNSQSTGALFATATYTLTCQENVANQTSQNSVTVNVNLPPANAPTDVKVKEPDYCQSNVVTIGWTYTDPNNLPQSAYEVQIAVNNNFASPVYDSGEINNAGQAFTVPSSLSPDTTYKARVKTWNSAGVGSSYSASTLSWHKPAESYPQTSFTWMPTVPQQSQSVQFTDHTTFGDGGTHHWSWDFGDGTTDNSDNPTPTHRYVNIGAYTVKETAVDASVDTCSVSNTINVIKPIPTIKEVAPK